MIFFSHIHFKINKKRFLSHGVPSFAGNQNKERKKEIQPLFQGGGATGRKPTAHASGCGRQAAHTPGELRAFTQKGPSVISPHGELISCLVLETVTLRPHRQDLLQPGAVFCKFIFLPVKWQGKQVGFRKLGVLSPLCHELVF